MLAILAPQFTPFNTVLTSNTRRLLQLQLEDLRSLKTLFPAKCSSDLTQTSRMLSVVSITQLQLISFKLAYLKHLLTFWFKLPALALQLITKFPLLGTFRFPTVYRSIGSKFHFQTASTVLIPVMTSYAIVGVTLIVLRWAAARSHGTVLPKLA